MRESLLEDHRIEPSKKHSIVVLNFHPYIILVVRSLFLINLIPRSMLFLSGCFTIVAAPYSTACFKRYLRMWSMQLIPFIDGDAEDAEIIEARKRSGYFLIPFNMLILLPSLTILFIITLIIRLIITILSKSLETLEHEEQADLFQQRNKVVIYGFDVTAGLLIWQIIPSEQFPLLSSTSADNEETGEENNRMNHRSIIFDLIRFCMVNLIWPILDITFRLIFLVQIVHEFTDPLLAEYANFKLWALLFFAIISMNSAFNLCFLIYDLVSFYRAWSGASKLANDSWLSKSKLIFEEMKKADDLNQIFNWIQAISFVLNFLALYWQHLHFEISC